MRSSAFYEDGSKLLTPGAFEFVLDSELKRAVRSQNFLTLVVVEASREWEGMTVTADDGTLHEVAQLIEREVRDTDVLGHTERGTLAIVLLDADFEHSTRVIERLIARIESYEFPTALRIAVGAACYPTHATGAGAAHCERARRNSLLGRSALRKHTMIHAFKRQRLAVTAAITLVAAAPSLATAAARNDQRIQPQQAAQAGSADDYRLGPGDKLRIEVYKDTQLSQSVQVRPDGKITLPLIGDVVAAGSTPIELRDAIGGKLKEYMNNPSVTVIVVEATAATAFVMGEVNHPGTVTLQGGPLTVIQALAVAGGLKDFADMKGIRILRRSTSGVQTIPFNYKEAIRGAAPVYLRPGDTVVVPD
jgi:polysaccharide export outer membrane protein